MPSLGPTGLTLHDLSGFGRDGSLENMDPATNWVTTEKGYWLSFNGTDQEVQTALNIHNYAQLTTSWWAYMNDTVSHGWIQDWDVNVWLTRSSGANVQFFAQTTSGQEGGTIDTYVANQRLHMVARYDGAEMSFWINGVKSATTFAQTGALMDGVTLLRLGGGSAGSEQFLDGELGPVAIYSRALTSNEIQILSMDPFAIVRQRAIEFPSAVVAPPAGGTTNPFSLGAVNLLAGKI